MAPSFFGMSSAVLTSVTPDGSQRLSRMENIRASRGSGPTEARVGMPEWTLCADQPVYARPHASANPGTPGSSDRTNATISGGFPLAGLLVPAAFPLLDPGPLLDLRPLPRGLLRRLLGGPALRLPFASPVTVPTSSSAPSGPATQPGQK
ncbi:hypothetical protein GCM10027615_04790 [Plantactinospora veratri]